MKKIMVFLPLVAFCSASQASTSYGSLGNFDVVNDTGHPCHGFEIEIDDAHSSDIGGTFEYNHYGTPKIREDNTDPSHPKVFIRYEAPAGATNGFYSGVTNPALPNFTPTNGHQCTNPFVNEGCEHFGVGLYNSTYTAVKYHWLVKDTIGNLVLGEPVNVSTPVWNYQPPVLKPNPLPNLPPIVQFPAQVVAAIPAPVVPIAPAKQFGEPSWVKVIKTSSHKARPLKLEELVGDDNDKDGHADWTNGEPDEVESEWYLLQTNNKGKAGKSELGGKADKAGDKGEMTITRRYEFYAYNDPTSRSLDGENGEAMCDSVAADNLHGTGVTTVTDAQGNDYNFDCSTIAVVGNYQGAQMGEFKALAPLDLIANIQDSKVGEAFPQRRLPNGGNTPYITTIKTGGLPNGLLLDSPSGILYGNPSKVGVFNFTTSVIDADNNSLTKAYRIRVTGPGDIDVDNDIDNLDLSVIRSKYSQNVAVNDPADLNGDLKVNILDYRKAASLCTKPQCAIVVPAP